MTNSFLLCVQGEGRGHLSQALAVYELLESQGHQICAVIVGSTGSRELPDYFLQKIKAPLFRITSPNFVNDKNGKGIHLGKTILHCIKQLGAFRKSLATIRSVIQNYKPDAVINFYEVMAGLYFRLNHPALPLISIAHQYIYFHPEFIFPAGKWLDRFFLKTYTSLTTSRQATNLALSFYRLDKASSKAKVLPPLLRKELFNTTIESGDHYLVYLVNKGYFEEVLNWHYDHPDQIIHCFTDMANTLKYQYAYNPEVLHLHEPSDTLFLELMRTAKGLATTAGFESVCEAMYFGKPVLMVPIGGHFEQFCNSRDAVRAGAGVYAETFDINKLEAIATLSSSHHSWFKNWTDSSRTAIMLEIEIALSTHPSKQPSTTISFNEL